VVIARAKARHHRRLGKLWLWLGVIKADYGQLPDFTPYDGSQDLVFTQNGTTAGVKLPNFDFIPENRTGLTINDATSAAFAQNIEWSKVDVLTYSWQKVMGRKAIKSMKAFSKARPSTRLLCSLSKIISTR